MMRAGVSTACLYPMPTEDALYDLALAGVTHVEIFINTHAELRDTFIYNLADILQRFDMTCKSVHPYTSELETLMLFSNYPRRLQDYLEYCKLYFSAMEKLGATIFVLHGSRAPAASVNRAEYFERYELLSETAAQFGVTVAQENVARCAGGSLNFLKDMKDKLGKKACFVLDIKQAVRAKEDPLQMLRTLGENVAHVHMSDHGTYGDCLLVGQGRFQVQTFLDTLATYNPNCSVILELYRSGFGSTADLAKNYHLLENMLVKAQGGKKE